MAKRITKLPAGHVSRFQQATKAYVSLRQKVVAEGILNRSYGYYIVTSFVLFFCLFFSAYEIFITPLSWQLVLWSFSLGFFMVQIGGLMHDAGHRAIAKSTRMNDILGHLYGGIVAVGYGAWNQSHNKHHSHTNQEDEDPDLDLPLHGFTQRQFAKQKG